MNIASDLYLPQSALAEICRRYEIKELMLFGSAVRGDMRRGGVESELA
jgi:predicted nucleotidyltransferase